MTREHYSHTNKRQNTNTLVHAVCVLEVNSLFLLHQLLNDLIAKGFGWRVRDTLLNHIAGKREEEGGGGGGG